MVFATAAAAAAVVFYATGPRAPEPTVAVTSDAAGRTIRGAFHIHTTRSDGALARPDVAAAAARAGLRFAVFTDHGDGTRTPDPPEYLHGVLCIDGVEISTNHGHYAAVGLPAAPYRLGGDGDTVAEDVHRLGGFGFAAHPSSLREDLRWADWEARIDGIEWLNADSEWRDEGRVRLARALIDYLWRPAGALASLLDRPDDTLARWDRLAAERPVVGIAAHDAHGGLGAETGQGSGRRVHVPSYAASFRTFSTYVVLARAPTGSAVEDAAALLSALRAGNVFTAIDAIAAPATLEFHAAAGGRAAEPGAVLPMDLGPARFEVRASAPAGAATVLLRNGAPIAEAAGGALTYDGGEPGVYRVEVRVPDAPGRPAIPWIVSNPIYRYAGTGEPRAEPSPPGVVSTVTVDSGGWRIESDGRSTGQVSSGAGGVRFSFALQAGLAASQFVALAADLSALPAEADAVVLRGSASQPMRLSIQVRFDGDAESRWGRSIYLDTSPRDVVVPLASLRPASAASGRQPRPPLARASSLLVVADLTNASPGSAGTAVLTHAGFARLSGPTSSR